MNILKAYADAGATGSQNYGMNLLAGPKAEKRPDTTEIKISGDSVRLSAEAMDLLENGVSENLSVCTNDTTYDQNGNMTRQVEALQRDLSTLARVAYAARPAMTGQINLLQARAQGLRAQV